MSQAFQILLLAVQSLILIVMGVFGWLARQKLREIERNTRFRRHLRGDDDFDGQGFLDDLEESLRADHAEVERNFDDLNRRLQRLEANLELIRDSLQRSEAVQVAPDERWRDD